MFTPEDPVGEVVLYCAAAVGQVYATVGGNCHHVVIRGGLAH